MTLTAEPTASTGSATTLDAPGLPSAPVVVPPLSFTEYGSPTSADPRIVSWVEKMAHLTTPDRVVWVDGSRAEQDLLLRGMVAAGTLTQLNPEHRPYSFLARSNPDDVARVEPPQVAQHAIEPSRARHPGRSAIGRQHRGAVLADRHADRR